MIWVRRGLAIPLIIVFVLLFVDSLVATQVNHTLGDADFYNNQARKADMYNFVYDGALPAALDEIEAKNDTEDIPVHLANVKTDTVTTVRAIIPPEWLRQQFESATETFLPYFLGETDQFTYTLVTKDRAETAAQVIKDDFLQGETFRSVYNDIVSYLAGKMYENLDQLPYDLALTKAEIESAIKQAAPPEWAISKVDSVIDSVTPYMIGDSDHFTANVNVADRVDIAAAVILELLSRQETYQYFTDELITPIITENIGQAVNLPFHVSVTQEEIVSAIEEVLPPSWARDRLKELVDSIAAYVKGETANIAVTVDLTDRKAVAMQVLSKKADQKLNSLFYSLPTCSQQEFSQIIRNLPANSIPSCRASGMSYEQFKNDLHISIDSAVQQFIGNEIPDKWVYTDADLRQSMGAENQDILDKARNWVRNGYSYTDLDLKDRLNSDENEKLEDIRDWIANGYTVDQTDLRDAISDEESDLESFDDARSAIHSVRKWMWAIMIVPFVLLVAIGFLAGRGWKGRIYWAFTILFITSLVVYIALTIAYSGTIKTEINDAFDLSDKTGLERVMLEKGNEVALNVADSFVSGIKTTTLWATIFSGLVLAGTVGWSLSNRRRKGAG